MTGFLRVERQFTRWVDRARRYRVVVDESPLGMIKPDETLTFSVPPGDHMLVIELGVWKSSPTRFFHVAAGETVTFSCRSAPPSEALARAVLRRHAYIDLEQAPPRT